MKLKIYLIIIFIALNLSVYYITQDVIESKIKYSKYIYIHNLQLHYENFMLAQAQNADLIYYATMNTQGVKDILSQAWKTKDATKRAILREKLNSLLLNQYREYSKQGLLQYHFVFPDNRVFLRVHKPGKYGDNLKGIRQDFEKVNETHQIVRGFAQGKTSHAFRNVYPIFDTSDQYIGAIEISYPSELLQNSLNKISEIHTHFLVNKNIFDTTTWSRNDKTIDYKQSIEHKDYMHALTSRHKANHMTDDEKRIKALHKDINENITDYKLFSLLSESNEGKFNVISFYPITENVTNKLSAWIVAYDDAPFIEQSVQTARYVRIAAFIIFALLLYFIYKTNKQKNELKKILNSYDENVILSQTDLNGKITHVSKAFCEISGYKEKELLGKPHNILRHKDMPKEVFADMWTTIKSGKTWKGEVKNLRKDGTFYWVDAELDMLYDENNHPIGYSAVRHDITDKKEIEEIQKEIIFTMGSIGESRSQETGNHVKRVAGYSRILAQKHGLSEEEVDILSQASPMHDIGKVGIPDSILKKPGKLNDEEFEIMKTHAELGYKMLSNSDRPLLKAASIVAHEHHEKWDGTGYPRGLKAQEIHIYGRITAIADVFDALGSERVYKKAWNDDKIFALFREESGKRFDPHLIDIFFANIDEFRRIRNSCKD